MSFSDHQAAAERVRMAVKELNAALQECADLRMMPALRLRGRDSAAGRFVAHRVEGEVFTLLSEVGKP